jgi:ATF/CREB family transcription factor
MMNGNGSAAGPTITPNTLNAISGVLGNSNNPSSFNHTNTSPTAAAPQSDNSNYIPSATSAATSHANGLFLLSQAHQELTKREEQARANGVAPAPPPPPTTTAPITNGTTSPPTAKRGVKRKNYDMTPPPVTVTTRSVGKRSRLNNKLRGISEDFEDEDDDGEGSNVEDFERELTPPPTSRRSTKKPETEEEKRRNFLERNRQGVSLPFRYLAVCLIAIRSCSKVSAAQKGMACATASQSRISLTRKRTSYYRSHIITR